MCVCGGGVCVVWAAWVGGGAETEAERHSQAKDNAVCVCVCVCVWCGGRGCACGGRGVYGLCVWGGEEYLRTEVIFNRYENMYRTHTV